jgi:IS5 family transposase
MAVALVLKELEGLSDRQAADALRCDIRWKVACGLPLDDPGVHFTVFTYWRTRLGKSERPQRINDAVSEAARASGVLAGRTRRALDSTLLDDAVATQDTVTQLVSAIRKVRRMVPEAAAVEVSAHDYDAAGKPVCAWDDPEAKTALVSALVNDARVIIAALEGVELCGEQADAVGLLALVAGQDVEPGEEEGTWRIAQRVAPDRVISTVDPEARHMHKSRSEYRDGYKAHVAVEPETGLITNADLTPANLADGPAGVALLAEEASGLQVLADSAYGSGEVRTALRAAGHHQAIKPMPLRPAMAGGFDRDDFVIDHTARTASCPGGHTVTISPKGSATFGALCRGCPLRDRCTTRKDGRVLTILEHDAELVAARQAWKAGDFTDDYRRWRPMVERSIAWLVADNHRRVRYRGVPKNQLGLSMRIAALNLRRLVNLGLNHNGSGWAIP